MTNKSDNLVLSISASGQDSTQFPRNYAQLLQSPTNVAPLRSAALQQIPPKDGSGSIANLCFIYCLGWGRRTVSRMSSTTRRQGNPIQASRPTLARHGRFEDSQNQECSTVMTNDLIILPSLNENCNNTTDRPCSFTYLPWCNAAYAGHFLASRC